MIVLDISIVITGLPEIRRDLRFSPAGLSWVQNAYLLAFGGLLLLGARAGDLLGRRRMFITGLATFTGASLSVGVAQSEVWLIAARALQGAGAAILTPSTLALLQTSFAPGAERTRAISYYAARPASAPHSASCSAACSPAGCPGASGSSSTCRSGSPWRSRRPTSCRRPSAGPAASTSRARSARPSR
jgi:MFS family permease